MSLQRLTQDGRIHPARIEDVVKKVRKQMEDHIKEIGERTVIDLGITGMYSELIRYVGRMRFRSSYDKTYYNTLVKRRIFALQWPQN